MQSLRALVSAAFLLTFASAQGLTIQDGGPGILGFVDISMTGGTAITGASDDSEHNIVTTIGNSLFPAGNVRISANGVVIAGIASGEIAFTNSVIPASGPPSSVPQNGAAYLFPFWDDLFPPSPNDTIWWQEMNGVLFIMWKNILHFPGVAGAITFEVQIRNASLDCGPSIEFVYQDTTFGGQSAVFDAGAGATIGYAGFNNAQWSFNTPNSVPNGKVLSLIPAVVDDLNFTSPFGPGSLQLVFETCHADGYILAVTFFQGNFPNGWLFGLDIPVNALAAELALGAPFVASAPGFPHFTTLGPFTGLPPVTLYAIVLGLHDGTVASHSDPVSYSIP